MPEAKCRDGSPTGFGIRTNPTSDKLFIFFGSADGACFNPFSCTDSDDAKSFDSAKFDTLTSTYGNVGIFDTSINS